MRPIETREAAMATKIAFASCMSAEHRPEQPVWGHIQNRDPQALMLLGDLIYMDWGVKLLFGTSHWPKTVATPTGLLRFQREMHAGYKRQWELKGFQDLVAHVCGQHVLATRDDHDYAWDDCIGAGNPQRPEHVPGHVKAISNRLFWQFVHKLRHLDGAYPDENDAALEPSWPTRLHGVDVMLLDQRSHRTHKKDANPTLLGLELKRLEQRLDAGDGLMIIGGSTPIQEWPSADRRAFVKAAERRPVLYLAGDIHLNRYDGRVDGSTIVQVVSSGAAQPPPKGIKLDVWKFAPGKFGILSLDLDDAARNGTVTIELFRFDKHDKPPVELRLKNGAWA
jgi:alkaline phosphatase D